MRLLAVSFLVLVLTGQVAFAGEAGLTTGTPVLSSDELKSMAPEPLPTVSDPSTSVKVQLKDVTQAEGQSDKVIAEREAAAKAKKAAAAKKAADAKKKAALAKKPADKKGADKKKDAKKDEKSKKADPKLAKKPADNKKKDAKKTDPKLAKKPESKKKDVQKASAAVKLAKADPKAKKAADKKKNDTSKKTDKKTDRKAEPKLAKKPAKPSKAVELAQADDEATGDDADEQDEGEKPHTKFGPVKPENPATHARKPIKLAVNQPAGGAELASVARGRQETVQGPGARRSPGLKGAAKLGHARPQPADEEALKIAPDPSVVTAADQQRFAAIVKPFLAQIAKPDAGGSVNVTLGNMRRTQQNGREVIALDGARIEVVQGALQNTHVAKAALALKELAFDAARLQGGACALTGTPIVVPDLTLEHAQVQGQLAKNNIKNPRIDYQGNEMVFSGKASYMFFKIGFQMAGHFERSGNNIAFRIASLDISGSPASASRLADVQSKLETMIKLENVLAPIGAAGAPVRGGKVSIADAGNVVYSTNIDRALPAE